ncbi:Zn-ribbon domain-containing OB-fold protein [Halorubrum halophilum]|uniref:Zn-ribbon domain-containing OB-fold protein n=1 Tax=Halorubrum halophilum TaxID=413816 RepID=UPI0006797FC5|nr:OB-fold domain-containing protein [Halorubrum halophilum]
MSDNEAADSEVDDQTDSAEPTFEAAEYADGAVTYPPHTVGPNGAERVGTVDLREYEGRVLTWTTSTATPPGVREPNTLAIVEFDMGDEYDGPAVRALGQIAEREDGTGETFDVDIGDRVEPVYADELREPGAGIREPESQDWDGFRFRPL